MGGAGRLSDLNWMLQQSICTAGFSKQFPDDGGGEMERKRQKWQCSNTICLVSEQLYISWFILQQVLLFKSAVLLHFNTFFKAVLVCFFPFLCCIRERSELVFDPDSSRSLGFPLGAWNNISVESTGKWDLDRGSICTILSLLIPPLWAWFLRVYFTLVLHEFLPQKSSSRVETTETAGPGPSICVYAWSRNPPWTLLHNCWQRASHVWVLSGVWCIFILAVDNCVWSCRALYQASILFWQLNVSIA